MSNPLTRAQQLENAAFLRHLRRTGNASTAARSIGLTRGRFTWRRARYPAFALRWDAALALAHASFGDKRADALVTSRGEPYIRRVGGGRLQVRRAQIGLIDHAGRQRFLAALCATANISLSAAAAGHSMTSFYRHRHRDPGFAREWQLALEMGYERLKLALMESWQVESFTDDDWRRNDPPAMPPMTAAQALHLMNLHQKEARLWSTLATRRTDAPTLGAGGFARSEPSDRMVAGQRPARERPEPRVFRGMAVGGGAGGEGESRSRLGLHDFTVFLDEGSRPAIE